MGHLQQSFACQAIRYASSEAATAFGGFEQPFCRRLEFVRRRIGIGHPASSNRHRSDDPLAQLARCDSPNYTAFKELFSQSRYGLGMADILALLAGFGVIGIVLAVLAVWMR